MRSFLLTTAPAYQKMSCSKSKRSFVYNAVRIVVLTTVIDKKNKRTKIEAVVGRCLSK